MRRASLVALLGVVGCAAPPPADTVHIQKRTVIARALSPNLMLVVDRSASMGQAVDPTAPGCTATCPVGCAPSCRTRLGAVQEALTSVLAARGTAARFGLAVFPDPGTVACTASSAGVLEPISAGSSSDGELQAKATIVANRLSAVVPAGEGRPIADALVVVGGLPELNSPGDGRADFVLVITAGAPDCGAMEAVQAIRAMRDRQLKTVIVGFGAEASTPAVAGPLDDLATAGGFARACPSGLDSECGPGDRCGAGGVCDHAAIQAATGTALRDQLMGLFAPLEGADPCVLPLEVRPASADALTVRVDGVEVQPGPDTWALTGESVTFQGALCERLRAATPQAPISLELRIVEQ